MATWSMWPGAAASGGVVDVRVTDAPEWEARTKRVPCSTEALIAKDAVTLAEADAHGAIDWDKEIGMPATTTAEMQGRFTNLARAVSDLTESLTPGAQETNAASTGDLTEHAAQELDRFAQACGAAHMVFESAAKITFILTTDNPPPREHRIPDLLAAQPTWVRDAFSAAARSVDLVELARWHEAANYVGDWAPQLDAPPPGLNPDASVMRLREDDLHRCRAGYYGLVNHVDDQVSRLLKGFRESGLLDDTFVLFTSDHGEMLGDHNLFRKTWPYEASIRVPFLARAPEWMDCTAGLTIQRPVGLQDVMPTILDVAGAAIPGSVDGASVLPYMRGDAPAWRDYLHGEHTACYEPDQGNQWVTDGHEKLVWYTQTGEQQFFDLDTDPLEMRNATADADARDRITVWRQRLIDELTGRPEGYVKDGHLVAGRAELRPEQLQPATNQVSA